MIEGLKPTDRPFLTAKTVFVNLPWWTIFSKELIVENVDMNDWQMLVEQFPGRHNFPRNLARRGPQRERWFKYDPASVIARNGQFTYDDHTVPWSVVCRNLNVHVFQRARHLPRHGAVLERHGEDPVLRPVSRGHADTLQD